METLGLTFIVGGAAFLCSGLVFLLPSQGAGNSADRSFEENLEEIENNLNHFRNERGEN